MCRSGHNSKIEEQGEREGAVAVDAMNSIPPRGAGGAVLDDLYGTARSRPAGAGGARPRRPPADSADRGGSRAGVPGGCHGATFRRDVVDGEGRGTAWWRRVARPVTTHRQVATQAHRLCSRGVVGASSTSRPSTTDHLLGFPAPRRCGSRLRGRSAPRPGSFAAFEWSALVLRRVRPRSPMMFDLGGSMRGRRRSQKAARRPSGLQLGARSSK